MSGFALDKATKELDPARLKAARTAFMSVPKSLTIRQGKVTGEQQLDERLRRAIAAYQAGTTV